MPVSNNMKFGRLVCFLILAIITMTACSIKESTDDCPDVSSTELQLLYLKVEDVLNGNDITTTENLEEIMVYLFNSDKVLIDTIPVTLSQLHGRVPIDLTDMDMQGGYVSVWANIGDSMDQPEVVFGESSLNQMTLQMTLNLLEADYYKCPGDIFFGYEKINFVQVSDNVEADTVVMMRKNARLNITVRGIDTPEEADDYYFRIAAIYSGYDYTGIPDFIARDIWEIGEFDDEGQLVSIEPYMMVHHHQEHEYEDENSLVIHLYRKGAQGTADTEVARANRDINGEFIHLEAGKTTNVLIILNEQTGELELITVITPWNEIHQWTNW